MKQSKKNITLINIFTGLGLILLGLFIFTTQFWGDKVGSIFFILLGFFLILGWLKTKFYGFLIPGCIFAGIGVGMLADSFNFLIKNSTTIGLGLGFLTISLITYQFTHNRFNFKNRKNTVLLWPLIPGTLLVIAGLSANSDYFRNIISFVFPMILVVIGLYLIIHTKWLKVNINN